MSGWPGWGQSLDACCIPALRLRQARAPGMSVSNGMIPDRHLEVALRASHQTWDRRDLPSRKHKGDAEAVDGFYASRLA